jgi:hypothetical protein
MKDDNEHLPHASEPMVFRERSLTPEEMRRGVSKDFVRALKQAGATPRFLRAVEKTRRQENEKQEVAR